MTKWTLIFTLEIHYNIIAYWTGRNDDDITRHHYIYITPTEHQFTILQTTERITNTITIAEHHYLSH